MCRRFAVLLTFAIIGTTIFFVWKKNKHFYKEETNIVKLLNTALADEWLAYYQYWLGALVIQGKNTEKAISELNEHAQDEFRHATMIAKRILQLGGTPILEPQEWYDVTGCGYEAPKDPQMEKVVMQNIKGEQCAIKFYKKLLELTKNKDPETHKMITEILKDEIEHEQDLKKLIK
jgi:bacterioferritin